MLYSFFLAGLCLTSGLFASARFSPFPTREESNHFFGTFIIPNEHDFHVFEEAVKGKTGAYITVGTLRSTLVPAYGNFSHVFVIDFDAAVKTFNTWNFDLIRKSTDRLDYIAHFFGIDSHVIEARRRVAITEEELFSELDVYVKDEFRKMDNGSRPPSQWGLNRAFLKIFSWWQKKDSPWAKSIFGSDELFFAFQKIVRSENYLNFTGSFWGEHTFSDVARALHESKVPASVVDLSNLLAKADHFQVKKTIANLKKLPLTPSSLVLFTHRAQFLRRKECGWLYFAMNAADFLDHFDKANAADSDLFDAYRTLLLTVASAYPESEDDVVLMTKKSHCHDVAISLRQSHAFP